MHIHIQAYTTSVENFTDCLIYFWQWGSNKVSYIYLCSSYRTFSLNRRLNTGPEDIHLSLIGAQWLSGIVLDSRLRGRRFEPHRRQCVVSLNKTH